MFTRSIRFAVTLLIVGLSTVGAQPASAQSTTADVVYGQGGSFTTGDPNNGGISAKSLASPQSVALDHSGNVYVADYTNSRVLFYPSGSTTATRVYGQGGNFTTGTGNYDGITADSLYGPYGLALDGSGNLYVADTLNNRVLFYPSGSTTATRVYGQFGNFTTSTPNNGGISANSLAAPVGAVLDSSGNLYVADQANNRVLFYLAGSTTATRVYGQGGSFTTGDPNYDGISADSLSSPWGVALDSSGNLYVADFVNSRVLFYLSGSTTATRVYGQFGNFTTNTRNNGGVSANSLDPPKGVALDSSGNLYVVDSYNSRVLFYPSGSTTATRVYGQFGSFTTNTANNGGISADSLYNPNGVALDSSGNLAVVDQYNNRVLMYPPIVAQQFVPLSQPCRAVDTRPGSGGGGPIQGGTFQSFPISSAGTCGALPSAVAYSMNVSVVPNGPLGYLTVWPAGQPRPLASTLNSLDGRIKANAAIIPAGTSGEISVYATNTTNVIVDVNGYFAPASGSTLAFYPLTPCRVADTRMSNFPQGLGPPFLPGGQERQFPILNATSCNIPSSAAAYSLNFSVVPHGSLFYMTVWPTGETRPTVSTLNDIPGQIIANAAIVTAGATGKVSVYPTNDTDLIIDINGYFAAAGTGGLSLYGVQPCRVIDTRHVGSGQPFSGSLSPPVDVVHSQCAPPATAQAYVFNASVVPTGPLGYLTLWPDGANRPVVSTLNALDGSISSNMAIVPSTNGKVDAYASGITQLILDISSYFAP